MSNSNHKASTKSSYASPYPSLQALQQILPKLPKDCKKIPIYKELYADFITPIVALALLKSQCANVFLLESMQDRKQWGRYSFLGLNPSAHFSCVKDIVRIESSNKKILDLAKFGHKILSNKRQNKQHIVEFKASPKEILRKVLKMYKSPNLAQFGLNNIPAFSGGLVGYFAYDYIGLIEKKLDFKANKIIKNTTKDIEVMLFYSLIVFDNLAQKLLCLQILTSIYAQKIQSKNYLMPTNKA